MAVPRLGFRPDCSGSTEGAPAGLTACPRRRLWTRSLAGVSGAQQVTCSRSGSTPTPSERACAPHPSPFRGPPPKELPPADHYRRLLSRNDSLFDPVARDHTRIKLAGELSTRTPTRKVPPHTQSIDVSIPDCLPTTTLLTFRALTLPMGQTSQM